MYSFALTTHQADFDALAAMRFSLEHQNRLVTGAITGSAAIYPSPTFSLLHTTDPNVVLWSLKPSDDGISEGGATSELIARFWNVPDKSATSTLALAKPIQRAWQTTHIETNERMVTPLKGRLSLTFRANQLTTYRLQF